MFSLKVFVICCSALSVISYEINYSELENVLWRDDCPEDDSIRPFEIRFTTEQVEELRYLLNNSRELTPPLEGTGFQYGFNTDTFNGWAYHWAHHYDFEARAAMFNAVPNYKTTIQGLDIQFLWAKPKVDCDCEVLPLIMLHSFPDSINTFLKTLPYLTEGCKNGFALEVVVPSLPGSGFSDGATKPGLGSKEAAVIMKLLMNRLGYKKFYVQGSDCTHIGDMMAVLYPEAVLGLHTNDAISYSPLSIAAWIAGGFSDTSLVVADELKDRLYPMSDYLKALMTELGYLHMIATKPDTLGVAMSTSPAALLSFIIQVGSWQTRNNYVNKFDGGLTEVFTRDEVLDDVTICWMTNSFTTAARLYADTFNTKTLEEGLYAIRTSVPVWSVHTKYDMAYMSPVQLRMRHPHLINAEVFNDYGHYLPCEKPEVFANSVLNAITAFRLWHEESRCDL
ncbi:juvenile hormone epoxide hydrolase-like [Anticarsia gemmatalis]|uniref:juvenile hormone epoxide hydrolase-like n=1 Tax=Anticarsia gemmatalis TaxID=129554 RepID=UPI003F75DA83